MRFFLLLLLLFPYFTRAAEPLPPHSVTGRIVDASQNKPLEFVTVSLLDAEGRAVVSSVTNADGCFVLRAPKAAHYRFYASLVGYKSVSEAVTTIEAPLEIGQRKLQGGLEIDEVVVEAKPLIKREVDRIVYDVSADPEAARVKMSDIMRKIPELRTGSADGKLEYQGEQVVQLFIDGMTDEVINRSRQYPMDFIKGNVMKTIEVILPGSPEYNNDKPIINIRLARPLPFGVAGEVAARAVTDGNYSPSVDLITKNKLGVFSADYTFAYRDSRKLGTESQRENLLADSENKLQKNQSEKWSRGKEHKLLFGYSRELFRKAAVLRLSAGTSHSEQDNFGVNDLASFNAAGALIASSATESHTRTVAPWRFNGQAALRIRLGGISGVDVKYNYTDSRSETTQVTEAENRLSSGRTRNGSAGFTGSVQHSVGIKWNQTLRQSKPVLSPSLNVGIDFFSRRYQNATHYYLYDEETQTEEEVETRYNGLEYTQRVVNGNVGFTSGKLLGRKFMLALFLRAEYIANKGTYLSTGNTKLDYSEFNLLPAVTLSFKPRVLFYRLMYTTRVLRPDVTKLNPYRDESNPEHIFEGNPALRGEYSHQLKPFVSRSFSKGVVSSAGVGYSVEFISGAIESVTTVDQANVALTTYLNLGRVVKQTASAEIAFSPAGRTNSLSIRCEGGYTQTVYNFTTGRNIVEGWKANISLMGLRLGRKGPQLSARYSLAPSYSSAQNKGNVYYSTFNASLSKYFAKIKLGGEIAVSDLFHGRKYVGETTASESFRMHSLRERLGRIVSFSLYWRFGRFRDSDRIAGISDSAYDR